jgi:hypothetical protein
VLFVVVDVQGALKRSMLCYSIIFLAALTTKDVLTPNPPFTPEDHISRD